MKLVVYTAIITTKVLPMISSLNLVKAISLSSACINFIS